MKQYDIWWATLPEPVGRRPVLLLTRTAAMAYLNKVIVSEITTVVRGIPQEVPLGRGEGLHLPSVANLDNVQLVRKSVLTQRAGRLRRDRHREVQRALGFALDWPVLKLL